MRKKAFLPALAVFSLAACARAAAAETPPQFCTGMNCMAGEAKPAEACQGLDCAPPGAGRIRQCDGQDCNLIPSQSPPVPEDKATEPMPDGDAATQPTEGKPEDRKVQPAQQ